jgi:hypothetical protein
MTCMYVDDSSCRAGVGYTKALFLFVVDCC